MGITNLISSALLIAVLAFSGAAYAQVTFNLTAGWNLLGNSTETPIDVATTFGDSSKITSVWKWNKTTSKWAFYTPAMSSSTLSAYALGRGYEVLASIAPKDGFWVNASASVSLNGPNAIYMTLGQSDLQVGWNLVGSADSKTPSQISQSLSMSLNAAGKEITAIWAWDKQNSKWKFYAPSLAAQGGTVLTDYLSSKGYLPFSADISVIDGYWVNVNTVVPPNLSQAVACAVEPHNIGDIHHPPSYDGAFTVPAPTQKLPSNVVRAIGFKDYYPGGYVTPGGACQDRTLRARNLYIETLNRFQADGVEQTYIYNYGTWDDFSKPIWTVDKAQLQIPQSEVSFIINEAAKRNIKVYLAWQFTAIDSKGVLLPMDANVTPAQLKQMLDSFHILIVDQAKTGSQIGLAGIYADWHAFYIRNLQSDPTLRELWITEIVSIISDIRKVFSGIIVYGGNTAVMDPRLAAVIDVFILSMSTGYGGNNPITPELNSSLTVSMMKEAFLRNIQQSKIQIDADMNGASFNVPISWAVTVTSKYDYPVNGWTEDGFCVNGCIQKTYKTDYSVQAIGVEAALEAIVTQTYFRTGIVDFDTSYWFTDDVGPTSMGWDNNMKIDQFEFPNLSQSLRNKPAESIVKYWFSR